jgi:GntR family transcriptional regulator
MISREIPLSTFLPQTPVLQESLPELTANRIREMILNGTLPSGTRLPNELELASIMGVSRGTLRSALGKLEQKGLIWRRQGIGSFVSEIPIMENRLDINTGVTDLIESMGLKPGCNLLKTTIVQANEKQAKQLNVPLDTALVSIKRIRTADDKPVVASTDLFPYQLLKINPRIYDPESLNACLNKQHSLYRVFERELEINIEYGIAKINPVKVSSKMMKNIGLNLPGGTVMLYLEQLDFDHERQPRIISYEYHIPGFCSFSVYRHK